MLKKTGLIALTALLTASSAAYAGPIVDTTPDGAKYQLQYSNVGNEYTFTFVADFRGSTTSPPLNTYALSYSIASVPGSVNWEAGSVIEAPGSDSQWGLYQGVVANSNGCPAAGDPSKDWCVGLKSLASETNGTQDGPKITNLSVLTFVTTMTLKAGSDLPDFTGDWSYKFVTTTGKSTLVTPKAQGNKPADPPYYDWEYAGYQISRTLTPCAASDPNCTTGAPDPVPDGGATLILLGSSLVGLGMLRRKIGF
jgi:hypothetical protein